MTDPARVEDGRLLRLAVACLVATSLFVLVVTVSLALTLLIET